MQSIQMWGFNIQSHDECYKSTWIFMEKIYLPEYWPWMSSVKILLVATYYVPVIPKNNNRYFKQHHAFLIIQLNTLDNLSQLYILYDIPKLYRFWENTYFWPSLTVVNSCTLSDYHSKYLFAHTATIPLLSLLNNSSLMHYLPYIQVKM